MLMEFRREIVLVNQLSSSRKDIVPSGKNGEGVYYRLLAELPIRVEAVMTS